MGKLTVKTRVIASIAGILLIFFSFQNCGRSGFQTYSDEDLLSSALTGTNPGGTATAPMAFDVGLDAIAYNSCVPNNKGAAGYFTVKSTAGGTRGGARLSPDFLTTAANTLKPIFGNAAVVDLQYKSLIEATSPGAEVQVALRSVTDLRAAYTGTSSGGIWGSHNYLSDDSWMTPLVESGRRNNNAWVPYSARAPSNMRRFDFGFSQDFAATDYWSNLLSAQNFRICAAQGCQNYGQFHIAVGFSEDSNKSIIRSPATYTGAQTKAYGRAYQMQFGYPENQTGAGLRVVKGIQEYNLATGNVVVENGAPTRWTCNEIPIVSPNQRGTAEAPNVIQTSASTCIPMNGNLAMQFYNAANLDKIRDLLPSSQWQLGYQVIGTGSRLCAIPRNFDCYPNEQFPNYQANGATKPYPYYVSYDAGQRCISEDNMSTELTRVDAQALNVVCGHYITVCTKQ